MIVIVIVILMNKRVYNNKTDRSITPPMYLVFILFNLINFAFGTNPDLFLLKNPEFYRSIHSHRDRQSFMTAVNGGWDRSHPEVTLPAIFKACRPPSGYRDNGHLNKEALVFLCNSLTDPQRSFNWTEYTQNSLIDQFLINCLKDSQFNNEVWQQACTIKQIPPHDLLEFFSNQPQDARNNLDL